MFQFYKGRTNNHLSWVMVDATDFATPESALSAAMKIKIWGKTRGATTVNFVSSGTGSLTNDIVHVGPSVLGIYSIALVKADLSDASAAWYDQYVISLSATGAAYQTLIADGGIDQSAISAYQSRLSDIASYLVALSSMESDLYSQLSDFRSDLHSFVSTTGVGLHASALSDIRSAIAAGPAATVTASDISDIASAVKAALASDISDILSAAVQTNSRVLVVQSMTSDVFSQLSDFRSDLHSFVSTTGVQLNASSISDLRSAIAAGPAATVTASDISDIASAVKAILASDISDILSAAVQTNSRVLLNQSRISDIASYLVVMSGMESDIYSQLSDFRSDLHSFVSTTGVQLNASSLSDVRSAITAAQSDLRSLMSTTGPTISDIASAVWIDPIALLIASRVSDLQSFLSDFRSDLHSFVSTTGVQLNASSISDLRSAIAAGPAATITASDISDIASAVRAILVSDLSDILSAATQTNSRTLVAQSYLSDIRSHVSDLQSDFQSRVPKLTASNSQLSDLHSDLRSYLVVMSGIQSDVYSLLSDVSSDLGVMSGVQSDIYSALSDFVSDFGSAMAEPTTGPTATPTIKQALAWNHALNRNKITQTATVQSLRNDADSADIASATVSDDGTTFTRGEWGN